MDSKIDKLHLAEKDFIQWLCEVNYSGSTSDEDFSFDYSEKYEQYTLIEGLKNGNDKRVSFILIDKTKEPYIIINSRFPKAEQRLTIEQFYEWMESTVKQKDSFLQQF